jgi:hypothetical protein
MVILLYNRQSIKTFLLIAIRLNVVAAFGRKCPYCVVGYLIRRKIVFLLVSQQPLKVERKPI